MYKGLNFYVINDLNANRVHKTSFDEVEQALKMFATLDDSTKMSVLGVETSTGAVDLIHKINGDNVLVEDYLRNADNLSDEMKENKGVIDGLAKNLVDTGVVAFKYNDSIVPWRDYSSVKVIVPTSPGFVPDKYCNDKILKAGDGIPATAINEILVDGDGWVSYKDFLKDPSEYVDNGVLKVEQVNVAYVKNDQLVGVNGQMDLSVDNFEAMAEKLDKPYYISVSDTYNIRYGRGNFAIASFDDLPSAVKAWYDVNDKFEFTPGVMDKKAGCCVFNGCDVNFEEISYNKAAELYGFEPKEENSNNGKLLLVPLKDNERSYTFRQSEEERDAAGLIGHLRADFGSGKEFWTTWNEFSESRKTSAFANELDTVINALRLDEKYNGILKDRDSLASYCWKNQDTAFNDGRNHYGVRVDTDKFSYLLRLNPNRGDYNVYCYCYEKELLNKHLFNAEKIANVDKLISDAAKTSQDAVSNDKGKTNNEKDLSN